MDSPIIGIEMGGVPLPEFVHPPRAVYLLGAEDGGLPNRIQDQCHAIISLPSIRAASFNVAQAGTLVLYDRMVKAMNPAVEEALGKNVFDQL